MLRTLAALAATAFVILTGLAQGYWTYRWSPPLGQQVAAERLARVPRDVGDWRGEDFTLPDDQVRAAGLTGYVLRAYTNRFTGERVTLLVVCGPPGPISVHTPDVCYEGAGYKMAGEQVRKTVDAEGLPGRANFWSADFRKPRGGPDPNKRVTWGWSTGDTWQAVDNPRFTFARARALYKLYVVRDLVPDPSRADADVGLDFLRRVLPELRAALSGEGAPGAGPGSEPRP
jgi:hypothetical protein